MLLFIWFYTASNNRQEQISIHLMLLFITNKRIFFQINSHISIHLMLLFIVRGCVETISLNYISIHLMLLFILPSFISIFLCFLYFNTSHVTVYHNFNNDCRQILKFQYISCYCLSCPSAGKNPCR